MTATAQITVLCILKVYIQYISKNLSKKKKFFLLPNFSLSAEISAFWQQHLETGQAGGRGRGKVPVTNLPRKTTHMHPQIPHSCPSY
jgi:hypothetical protein